MLHYLDIDEQDIQDFHLKIINNVRRIRKEKKITQTELSQTIGHKSVSTIGKIEANIENKHYNIEQLYKISIALDTDIGEFFK
ncbi:MAG: helix-turn-helix transcriptional regulator [Arcobacteraceae bacterium]|nr:helix-turn-helix transcriptional regulator [Arcobacteraceae bacterium]